MMFTLAMFKARPSEVADSTVVPMPQGLAWACTLLAVMMIAWSPFSGGARLPTALLSMVGVFLCFRPGVSIFRQSVVRRWSAIFMLLWLPMWLSCLQAEHPQASLVAIAWFSVLYFAALPLLLTFQSTRYRQLFAQWVTGIMLLWMLDSSIQYIFGVDLLGIAKTPEGRITGMFHDLHQGILMLPMLPLLFYHWLPKRPWLAWGLVLGVGVVVTLSGARGYLYIFLLMLLLALWQHRASWKVWAAVLCLPLLAVALAGALSPQLAKYKLQHTQAIADTQQSTFDRVNHALSYRLNLWETGLHMWQAHPLTGVGSNHFKRVYAEYATRSDDPFATHPTHSHNIYVEWLAETGLVGGIGLVAIMWLCVTWFRQAAGPLQQQAWPYALPLMVIYFPLNTTQPMLVPWWFPVLILLTCLMIASLQRDQDAQAS